METGLAAVASCSEPAANAQNWFDFDLSENIASLGPFKSNRVASGARSPLNLIMMPNSFVTL